MAMPTQTEEAKITILDIRMAVAVLVCFLVSTICSKAGLTLSVEGRNIEVHRMYALLSGQYQDQLESRCQPNHHHFYRWSGRYLCDLS